MYFLDTNVVSSFRRIERNPEVGQWVASQRTADLYLSVVTVGEIERGITQQKRNNPAFAANLALWLDQVLRW